MSDFSDRPFVAGSLIGLRAFGVDNLGRLHGPSVKQVFRPEENVAECRKGEAGFGPGGFVQWVATSSFMIQPPFATFTEDDEPTPPTQITAARKAEPNHPLAGLKCSCGFYAYFDGSNDYKESNRVAALIEGYGVCTVGSRGFRAEKARLVALIRPGKRFPSVRFDRVARNYPEVPVYDNRRTALIEHPLTVPDVPTPSDPDFWERPVRS